jgi:hypothetical protein
MQKREKQRKNKWLIFGSVCSAAGGIFGACSRIIRRLFTNRLSRIGLLQMDLSSWDLRHGNIAALVR